MLAYKRICFLDFIGRMPVSEMEQGGIELCTAEALAARELIKLSVLQNCGDDPNAIAELLAEHTHSQVVQVIGKKIVLYKEGKNDKKRIELPR